MYVELDHERLRYCGRIDWSNPREPEFIFPCTFLRFRFYGAWAALTLENHCACWDNYMGGIIDGVHKKWLLPHSGETRLLLAEGDREGFHDILFYKRQDSCHQVRLKSLELSEGGYLEELPPESGRRMEVYGDSVSAGEVSEAVEYVGKPDPEHRGEYSDSWYSYAWIAARKLGASLHDIAQGGIPLLNGSGYVAPPDYPGMETMWDKLHYHPQLGPQVSWDFSRYTPQLVVAAIGQNDSYPRDYMRENPGGREAEYWKERYEAWIRDIRRQYPRALILLTTTLLCHDESWDRAIEEVCVRLGDDRIRHFLYRRNGCGTPGHLRIPEAEEMAEELTRYINELEFDVWEEGREQAII